MKTNLRTKRVAINLFALLALLVAALGMPGSARAAQPANDIITNAIAITAPSTTVMSDVDFNDAINGTNDPNVCGFGNPGVHTIWYSFTPTAFGKADIDTLGSSFDTILAVWTYSGGVFQPIACNDDTATGVQSSIENLQLQAGTKYYIEVVQYTSGSVAPQRQPDQSVGPALISNYMTLNLSYTQDSNVAVPGVKYDDKNPVFSYTGAWVDTSATKAFSGSYKLSKVPGNKALITFAGIGVKVYFTKYNKFGQLGLYLDGNTTPIGGFTQYVGGTAYAFQQVYISPTFPDGVHTLELRHMTKQVSIDAIEIIGPPDLIPPANITDLSATTGASYGAVDLSWTSSGDDGTDGTAKYYEVRYSTNPITSDTTWNAATKVTNGVPTPQPAGQTEAMTVTGLGVNLTYHFAVKVFDEPATDTTGSGLSNPASADTSGPPPSGLGIYDDKDTAKWFFAGTWTSVNASPAYGGSYRWSNVLGNSASFVFTGTKFTLTYLINSSGGIVDVRVDGVSVAKINMKSSLLTYNKKYTFTPAIAGTHTVQFVVIYGGTRLYIDAIQIQ